MGARKAARIWTPVAVASTLALCASLVVVPAGATTSWSIESLPAVGPGPMSAPATPKRVSCVSASWCLAVGSTLGGLNGITDPLHFSYPIAYVPITTTTWASEALPTPPGASNAQMNAVSCTSTTACVAVGEYSPPYASTSTPMADVYSNGTWSASSLPGNSDQIQLTSVSCPSSAACVAVGSSSNTPYVEILSGTTWSATTVPTPSGGTGSGHLTGVTCAQTAAGLSCTAVGDYDPSPTETLAMAVSLSDGAWASVQLPTPDTAGEADLSIWSVSCATPVTCEAVSQLPYAFVADSLTGGTWTSQTLPLPAGATLATPGNGFQYSSGVSCSSDDVCEAVGDAYLESQGGSTQVGLVETQTDGSWSPTLLGQPPGADQTTLEDVSCSTDQYCVAVGVDIGNGAGQSSLAETLVNGSWAPTTLPDPPTQPIDESSSVSCSAPSACVSVGNYFTNSAQVPFAESLTSGSWSPQSLPLPKRTPPGPGGGIFFSPSPMMQSVSCVSSSWCVAVGQYEGRGRRGTNPLIDIFDAGTWTVQNLPRGHAELSAVSCTSTTSCVAVGAESNGDALVATLAGTTWTESSLRAPKQSLWLDGVTCQTAATCVAVGAALGSLTPDGPLETPVVATLDNGSWAMETLPLPSDNLNYSGVENPSLQSVWCQSIHSCVAVGSYISSFGDRETPLIEMLANGRWIEVSPDESDGGFLAGVSCVAKGSCVAVGATAEATPVIDTLSGGNWEPSPVSVPGGDSGMVLQSVSCPDRSSTCMAVGQEANPAGVNPVVATIGVS